MKYGFIGCGHMGGAIAARLCQSTKEIAVSDRSGRAKTLADSLGIAYMPAEEIAAQCDRIFLAVKPQMLRGVLESLRGVLTQRKPLIISMAAGIEISALHEMLGAELPCIRIMPNTPVTVGMGLIPYSRSSGVSDSVLDDWLADMTPCGRLDALEERLMDAVGALSGSGPAYMYMFLDALADGAAVCGLPKGKALDYAAQTMAGAAEMLLRSGQHPAALKDAVCSPGGSTLAGVQALESASFRSAAMECVIAACKRNQELGK